MPRASDNIVRDYLGTVAPFARPIVKRFCDVIAKADSRITVSLKWGKPSFEYQGILCGIAAFKRHVSWGFWKGELLKPPPGTKFARIGASFMSGGSVGDVSELPSDDVLRELVRQAIALNEQGVSTPKPKSKKIPVVVPADLKAALARDKRAREQFDSMSPSHRREYVEWIVEAKRPETRERRVATTVEWVREGKSQKWRYEKSRSGGLGRSKREE